jgi:hypothetical protein
MRDARRCASPVPVRPRLGQAEAVAPAAAAVAAEAALAALAACLAVAVGAEQPALEAVSALAVAVAHHLVVGEGRLAQVALDRGEVAAPGHRAYAGAQMCAAADWTSAPTLRSQDV